MEQVNWIATGIATTILTIAISILSNVLTDPVKNWFANRFIQSRRKRVDQLIKELATIEKYYNEPKTFGFEMIGRLLDIIFAAFMALISMNTIISIYIFEQLDPKSLLDMFFILAMMVAFMVCFIAFMQITTSSLKLTGKVKDFDKYKASTEKRIAELQAIDTQRQSGQP
jgi:hypothetical protein